MIRESEKDTEKHQLKLKRRRKSNADKKQMVDSDKRILNFKQKVMLGPYYICVVCNRTSYRQMFVIFQEESYDIQNPNFFFAHIKSPDEIEYICLTCHRKLRSKGDEIPCQAVCNKLELYDLPVQFEDLNKLERALVSKRLLFKKIAIMPKGQYAKVKGAICNVPVDDVNVCSILPRSPDNNGLIFLKLKKKLAYRGHVLFEAVRPEKVNSFLQYLKYVNRLYYDIEIDITNIPFELSFVDDSNPDVLLIKSDCAAEMSIV